MLQTLYFKEKPLVFGFFNQINFILEFIACSCQRLDEPGGPAGPSLLRRGSQGNSDATLFGFPPCFPRG